MCICTHKHIHIPRERRWKEPKHRREIRNSTWQQQHQTSLPPISIDLQKKTPICSLSDITKRQSPGDRPGGKESEAGQCVGPTVEEEKWSDITDGQRSTHGQPVIWRRRRVEPRREATWVGKWCWSTWRSTSGRREWSDVTEGQGGKRGQRLERVVWRFRRAEPRRGAR